MKPEANTLRKRNTSNINSICADGVFLSSAGIKRVRPVAESFLMEMI